MEEWIKERIEENKELFTKKELKEIKQQKELIKKIYILGLLNGNQIQK